MSPGCELLDGAGAWRACARAVARGRVPARLDNTRRPSLAARAAAKKQPAATAIPFWLKRLFCIALRCGLFAGWGCNGVEEGREPFKH